MTIEDDVLKKIVPTAADVERINGTADRLVKLVRTYMDENGIDAELRLVGSYAKGTYLSNPDLDLFIMFPPGTPREALTKEGLEIGEKVLHGSRMYAEHPYTSAVFEGVDVDLVPNIHIESTDKLETAVDRTPFHAEYVLRNMEEGQNDQIRLLKKFMKGIGTYGAEPNVRGFSGYLCELLVLKYGSFDGVLEAAATKWREGVQITLEKKTSQLEGVLVFYDPVDGKRNVASAVHADTMGRFICAAKDYLAHPSELFFFPNKPAPLPENELRILSDSGDFRLLSVILDKPDSVMENIHAQLWRTRIGLGNKLDTFGFGVMRAEHAIVDGKMVIAYMLATDRTPCACKRIGPPVTTKSSENFLKKWEDGAIVKPFIEDGKWCAIVPAQYTDAKKMLESEACYAGIGKEIDLSSMVVLGHEDAVEKTDRQLLTDLLRPTPAWKR